MATKVASLYAEIGADNSGLKRGLQETDTALRNTEGRFTQFGAKLSDIGLKATIGMTVPILAGFAKMVDSASDLSETMNKVDVVFGDAADEVKAFGRDAAQSLGMSQQKALDAAGTFGNLFTSMGLTADASAKMSTELLTLAADLASFNNIDPTVALEKLQSGLIGEYMPLRSVGVALSETAVNLKGVELGLISTGEEMTNAEKIQARYALILEQTTNAQGDFARTSDGLANSTRIVKAQIQDAAAEMGENLLPIALDLTTTFSGLVQKFSDMDPAGQKAILAVAGIAAATGPLLIGLGNVIKILPLLNGALLALAANPVVLVVAGLAAIGFAAYTLIGHNEDLIESTDEVASHFDELEGSVRETQQRFEEYRTVIGGLVPGTFEMNEAHAATIETLHGEEWAMSTLNATIIDTTASAEEQSNVFGGLFEKYNDVESAQQSLINQGIEMIEGLGSQARATALLAYWNGELSLAEYQAAVSQSYQLDALQQLNDAFAEGAITQLTWMAIMSDGVVTTEELANALNNGTSEVASIGDEMNATATGPALALKAELTNIAGLANSIEGTYDMEFRVSVTGDPIPSYDDSGGGGHENAFASGTDAFVVPPGFEDDSYPIRVSSGEVVTVSKPGDAASVGGDTYYITINAGGGADGIQLYNQFKQALENDLRSSERGGVQTSDY